MFISVNIYRYIHIIYSSIDEGADLAMLFLSRHPFRVQPLPRTDANVPFLLPGDGPDLARRIYRGDF